MKIIESKVELWKQGDDAKAHVARCARVCYGRTSGNDGATIKRLIKVFVLKMLLLNLKKKHMKK